MVHGGLLGLIKILEHRPRGDHAAVVVGQPQPVQAIDLKMLPQHLPAALLLEEMGVRLRHGKMIPVL